MSNPPEIDHEGPRPVYVQVADIIAARIDAGDLQPDRPIPSEARMAEEFGVARLTARRAVRELRDRGLVVTVPGRGTFVRPADGDEQD
ncbi:regulatory protein, gntR family [Actinomadura madurae]|uniref:Regulatory protein, gntR family n=1 Tax=Actinomadura madurae TaxID=1993 RepID=A0A1I5ETA5_9ACTN|nr:winged helix-turn-helix domain-containing protein [Actinomadura madurae]SFO14271.1 regulatory protein, gntR family [Actinomadura madurae]